MYVCMYVCVCVWGGRDVCMMCVLISSMSVCMWVNSMCVCACMCVCVGVFVCLCMY